MNREIKFRVWNKKTNNWVEGCGRSDIPSCDGVNLFGETILMGEFMIDVSLEDLNECVALQATGLKDKNRKDIFEGDIVISDEEPGSFEIKWNVDAASFDVGDEPWPNAELTVIGNIFQNPELLK